MEATKDHYMEFNKRLRTWGEALHTDEIDYESVINSFSIFMLEKELEKLRDVLLNKSKSE